VYKDEDLVQLIEAHKQEPKKEIRDQLIIALIPLAKKICFRLSSKYPRHRGQILDVCLFYLVKAVDRFLKKQIHTNIGAYVNKTLYFQTLYYLMCDNVCGPKTITLLKQYKKQCLAMLNNETLHIPVVVDIELAKTRTTKPDTLLDLEEIINNSTTSEFERQVVDLVIEGYNNREIANRLQTSISTTRRTKEEIMRRIRRQL
jgi:DNA-directed RNA polymerase specialized sigma subunit